jgi:uncharacterized protein (DUF885 family)
VNLYKPRPRPEYEIPLLTVHEPVPGHYRQIALAQALGDEVGLCDDPYDKFGQLRILALRREAEQALGPKFDLRAFHDAVLEQHVRAWIAVRAGSL